MTILRSDPGTQTATSVEGWEYPFPRLQAMVADLWDLTHAAAGPKKPVAYPRPFGAPREVLRHGNTRGRTPEEVKSLLAAARDGRFEAPV